MGPNIEGEMLETLIAYYERGMRSTSTKEGKEMVKAAAAETGLSEDSVKEDDEDYWSESSASTFKAHVNLFDDSIDLDSAKRMLAKPNMFDEDEDEDVINWDGTSISSGDSRVEFKSARVRPPNTLPNKPNFVSHSRSGSSDFSQSGAKASMSQSATLSDDRTIEDVVGGRRSASITEVSKMESEIATLKRNLEAARKNRFEKIPIQETVKRIIYGQPYSFEMYKSKEDKIKLLDESVKQHDGNAIIAAVLFLQQTIKQSIFYNEMMQRSIATEHYISYLRQKEDWSTLMDFLAMLGRSEEAAILKYKQAVSVKNPETQVKNLKNVMQTHFGVDASLAQDAALVQEHISLLERQQPIEKSDSNAEQQGHNAFKALPRKASIVNQPVMTTLYYACLYHYGEPENILSSPLAIKKAHALTDKQFTWVAMQARAKLKCWSDLELLFKTKGWFGGTKMKASIGFDKVLLTLHRIGAPMDILNKYCLLIEDTERRMELAKKLQCNDALIETFKQQKDRVALDEFFRSLKPNTQEWYFARDILQASTVKWKN